VNLFFFESELLGTYYFLLILNFVHLGSAMNLLQKHCHLLRLQKDLLGCKILNEITGNESYNIECRTDSQSLWYVVRASIAVIDTSPNTLKILTEIL